MSFQKRGFQDLVDDILTELTGGVVNEPILFRSPSSGAPASASAARAASSSSSMGARASLAGTRCEV